MKQRILFLEAGGPASVGILKYIKNWRPECTTVACDMDEFAAGRLFADRFRRVPPASDPNYGPAIATILADEQIDLVIPSFHYGFEALRKIGSAAFIMDFETGLLCQDKLRFYESCRDIGLPVPETRRLADVSSLDGPLYIKPRFGVGSKNHFTAHDNTELLAIKTYVAEKDEYVAQELIGGTYWQTAGFVQANKLVSCITFETLRVSGGNSSVVRIAHCVDLARFTQKVVSALQLAGAFNLQVFEREGRFTIIEINPRLGSNQLYIGIAGHDLISYLITDDPSYLRKPTPGLYIKYGDAAHLSR